MHETCEHNVWRKRDNVEGKRRHDQIIITSRLEQMGLESRFKTAGAEREWRISQGTDRWGWRWSRSWTTSLRWRSGRSCCARSCRCRRRRWRSACSADARCRRRSGRGPGVPGGGAGQDAVAVALVHHTHVAVLSHPCLVLPVMQLHLQEVSHRVTLGCLLVFSMLHMLVRSARPPPPPLAPLTHNPG